MGFFTRLFSRDTDRDGDDQDVGAESLKLDPLFAFVCLNDDCLASEKALREGLCHWFGLSDPDEIEHFQIEEKEEAGSIAFTVGGRAYMAALMHVPVPEPDLKYACQNAQWYWEESWEAMKDHRTHLLVSSWGEPGQRAEGALALSRAMAALAETHNAAGVYWGHASTVHPVTPFCEAVKIADGDEGSLPTALWIGILLAQNEDGSIDCYTDGLDFFGLKELEILATRREPGEVVELMLRLGDYLILNGDVIGDGDTVGASGDERIETSYEDSAIGREESVIRLQW